MSHADTIRAYYAAWLADDMEGVLRLCTDDVVAVNVPIGPIHGKDAVRAFFTKFARGMRDKRYEVKRVLVDDLEAVGELAHDVRARDLEQATRRYARRVRARRFSTVGEKCRVVAKTRSHPLGVDR